ncbi:MAG: outer membrane beta-barrel protein [Ignavibacteriales bacterium]|nr:outer membrane beta-barrel protein [Ignavibacteriales bacterium]
MRSSLLILTLSLLLTSIANAQFRQSDVELTFSGSFGAWESSVKATSTSSNYTFTYTSAETRNFVSLSIAPGYYIFDGLSVEPQIGIIAVEKREPTFFLLGNISYTYSIPDSRVAPFALIGYGISNAVTYPMYGEAPIQASHDLNIPIFNAGGGIKTLLTSDIVLRAEINYRKFMWTDSSNNSFGTGTSDNKHSTTAFIFGFSILL